MVCAHSIWIDEHDIRLLADSGTMVAHNPASNLKLGSGIAPIRELLESGVTVALGTDGSMASDNQNMFEAMRFAALVGNVRFAYEPDKWLSASEVFEMATISGAKVLGLDGQIGKIEVGRKADIVLLNSRSSFLRPTNNVRNALVYAETAADVQKVFVGGRLVVADGRVLTIDEEDIYLRAQVAIERLISQNEGLFAVADRLTPFIRSACALCAKAPMAVDRHAH
jgi:5-methylthioadenosine/S-adenosylhomocysteine deaminase